MKPVEEREANTAENLCHLGPDRRLLGNWTTTRVRNTISINEPYSTSLRNAFSYRLCAAFCAASNF